MTYWEQICFSSFWVYKTRPRAIFQENSPGIALFCTEFLLDLIHKLLTQQILQREFSLMADLNDKLSKINSLKNRLEKDFTM